MWYQDFVWPVGGQQERSPIGEKVGGSLACKNYGSLFCFMFTIKTFLSIIHILELSKAHTLIVPSWINSLNDTYAGSKLFVNYNTIRLYYIGA